MACDQLVSLNMVDYQGNVLVASNTSNTDLLWASCGGGGTFPPPCPFPSATACHPLLTFTQLWLFPVS